MGCLCGSSIWLIFCCVPAIVYAISYHIGPRYNGTRLYVFYKRFSTERVKSIVSANQSQTWIWVCFDWCHLRSHSTRIPYLKPLYALPRYRWYFGCNSNEISSRWFSARLQYLQCISNGDTSLAQSHRHVMESAHNHFHKFRRKKWRPSYLGLNVLNAIYKVYVLYLNQLIERQTMLKRRFYVMMTLLHHVLIGIQKIPSSRHRNDLCDFSGGSLRRDYDLMYIQTCVLTPNQI